MKEVMTMRKYVTMYAKFAFIVLWTAIAFLITIVFDIAKDIICTIILLFRDKFNTVVIRADMAEMFEDKTRNLKNTLNEFKECIDSIIED